MKTQNRMGGMNIFEMMKIEMITKTSKKHDEALGLDEKHQDCSVEKFPTKASKKHQNRFNTRAMTSQTSTFSHVEENYLITPPLLVFSPPSVRLFARYRKMLRTDFDNIIIFRDDWSRAKARSITFSWGRFGCFFLDPG